MRISHLSAACAVLLSAALGLGVTSVAWSQRADSGFEEFLRRDREAFKAFVEGRDGDRGPERHRATPLPLGYVHTVEGPDTAASLLYERGITLAIPAGIAAERCTFSLAEITPGDDAPIQDLATKPLFALSMKTDLPALPGLPALISMQVDRSALNPNYTPREQIRGQLWDADAKRWMPLDVAFDEDEALMTVTLDRSGFVRLSSAAFRARLASVTPAKRASLGETLESAVETVGGVVMSVPNAIADVSVHFEPSDYMRFKRVEIAYNESQIRYDKKVGDAAWPKNALEGISGGILQYPYNEKKAPNFIVDMATCAEAALDAYTNVGFRCPPLPLHINVDSLLLLAKGDPGLYNFLTGEIHISSQVEKRNPYKPSQLQHRVAHEVFHAMQAQVLPIFRRYHERLIVDQRLWWLESTAEFASCRVPWDLGDLMAADDDFLYRKLPAYPLWKSGSHGKGAVDIEYDKSYFAQFLSTKPGYDLFALHKAVAKGADSAQSRDHCNPITAALATYYRKTTGTPFSELFEQYATYFFRSKEVPEEPNDEFPFASRVSDLPKPGKASVQWTAGLEELSARMWVVRNNHSTSEWVRVQLDDKTIVQNSAAPTPSRVAGLVSVGEIRESPSVDPRLKRDARNPRPVARLFGMASSAVVKVATNEAVVIIACNANGWQGTSSLTFSVGCCDAPVPSYHFKAPHGESVALSWTPSWDLENTPEHIAGYAVRVSEAVPKDPNDPMSPMRLEEYWLDDVLLPPAATNATVKLDFLKGRLGKIGLAPKVTPPTGRAGDVSAEDSYLPVEWAEQELSVWQDFWDAAQTKLKRQYQYRVDLGGMRIREGLEARWYENGKKEIEGTRLRNREHGLWQRWFPTGAPYDALRFDKGQRIGPYRAVSAAGSVLVEGAYQRDRKVGRWDYFYENGRPLAYGNYVWKETTNHEYGAPSDASGIDAGLHHKIGNKTGTWTYFDSSDPDCKPRIVNYD